MRPAAPTARLIKQESHPNGEAVPASPGAVRTRGSAPKSSARVPKSGCKETSGSPPAGPEAEGDRSAQRRQDRRFRIITDAAPLKLFVVVL